VPDAAGVAATPPVAAGAAAAAIAGIAGIDDGLKRYSAARLTSPNAARSAMVACSSGKPISASDAYKIIII
jgi:hypothetical protein